MVFKYERSIGSRKIAQNNRVAQNSGIAFPEIDVLWWFEDHRLKMDCKSGSWATQRERDGYQCYKNDDRFGGKNNKWFKTSTDDIDNVCLIELFEILSKIEIWSTAKDI